MGSVQVSAADILRIVPCGGALGHECVFGQASKHIAGSCQVDLLRALNVQVARVLPELLAGRGDC